MSAALRGIVKAICLCFVISCGQASDQSELKYFQGTIRGHEELLRRGIITANELISQHLPLAAIVFPGVGEDENGQTSRNMILRGGYATDNTNSVGEFSLNEFYGQPADQNLAYLGPFQHHHFLRDFGEANVDGSNETCTKAKETVVRATVEAMNQFGRNDDRFLFFLGHAIHVLQDSFSPAHVRRSEDGYEIRESCVYDKKIPNVCEHLLFDLRDSIWRNLSCDRRDWSCLTDGAQMATSMTAGFLFVSAQLAMAARVFPHSRQNESRAAEAIIRAELTNFFENPLVEGGGYFRCPID